ncbi:LysR substrate-binding domain-containing protein [Siccirubricoccus sp. G192]|uniref:LysR substrate-binding domain-containing protein n=1 Tax=Siccirubricoccus sp. G192 TaxID=2849651 RepID=UPI001C2C4BA7|nr:LysR substrate-binding domain-containing protein [Siccirubricoccus sp. G192]MBV1798956.1 LysR family transcriptional regulator [Siccirubricoccus sp. G192]
MSGLPPGLDPDLLRAFVLVAEGGSVTRAAQRVGRTQSAVSMQMRRLEELLGQPLLERGPRGMAPTPHGAWLLERARSFLAMHDEILAGFHAPGVAGTVRLGTPDDYALRWLPGILAAFAETHPAVEVQVTCAASTELVERLRRDELDLSLITEGDYHPSPGEATTLWRGPLHWVGSATQPIHRRDPLPLALAHPGCCWRSAALRALEAQGRRFRVAYTSQTQTGTHAPALAGLAITISTPGPLPPGLRRLGAAEGLPPLPEFGILLLRGGGGVVAEALAQQIEAGFQADTAMAELVEA